MSFIEIPRAPIMFSPAAEMKRTLAVTPRKTMRGHTGRVFSVVHLPGGDRIITCSIDGSLRLWDLESSAQICEDWQDEGDESGVCTMALSPNGKTIASGNNDGTLKLWDVETGKVIAKWIGHSKVVNLVDWNADGERVVSGSNDGMARVWDVKSGEPVQGLDPIS